MRATLTRMITVSDNAAADAVYRSVGREGLARFAGRAGMRSFRASGAWILCRVAAADMARFFRDMERYIPSRHRSFANGLLAGVVSYQRWGIPAAAGPLGYRVYFKPGWLGAWVLANQAARLERAQGPHRPRRLHGPQPVVHLRQGDGGRRHGAAAPALSRRRPSAAVAPQRILDVHRTPTNVPASGPASGRYPE